MNAKHLSLLVFSYLLFYVIPGQGQPDERNSFRIAFYNLENLFDTEDDPAINDEEFAPEGTRYWTTVKYNEKSNRMAKAILSIGGWEAPDIVGVAEIENNTVLTDLIDRPALSKYEYGIVHYESPDRRGIDVGMLYRKDRFTPLFTQNIAIKLKEDPDFTTRDILYVKGYNFAGDTLHLFFCHWPSRYGGQQQSEPKRIQAAITLRKTVDSVFSKDPGANIIIAGDFNDEWKNVSLSEYLGARENISPGESTQLVNLMASLNPNEGSHFYRGKWAYLDQVIVSSALLNEKGLDVQDKKATVLREEFLLERDEKYPGMKPFRTFIGMRYNGGFSDHLPVYIDLVRNETE